MRTEQRRRSRLLRWFGRITALLVSLAFVELALSIIGLPADECRFVSVAFASDTFVPDDDRFWRLSSTAKRFEVNELGLRGWWPSSPKTEREYRIACVGDSCTFGTGVPYAGTYGLRLQEHVQEALPDRDVRSSLMALPGYSTFQSKVLLLQDGEELQPDLVVLYCGAWNDYLPAYRFTDAVWAERQAEAAASPHLAMLFRRLANMREHLDVAAVGEAFQEGATPHGRRVPLADYRENLRKMTAWANAHGSTAVIVLPPIPRATVAKHPIVLQYRDASRTVAAETGAVLFDADRAIREFEAALPNEWQAEGRKNPITFIDWVHPSALGHAVIARSLFAELTRASLLPATASRAPSEAPAIAPAVSLTTSSSNVTLSWAPVANATGYTLYYSDKPNPETVHALDLGQVESITVPLWEGASFRARVQAYGALDLGPMSAGLQVDIPSSYASLPSTTGSQK